MIFDQTALLGPYCSYYILPKNISGQEEQNWQAKY